uniref:PCIF1_WW domain-containing protein n=1 Tax=Macrostomum lignano TaxID=282301 RepID=A0A1I8FB15_9PLAT
GPATIRLSPAAAPLLDVYRDPAPDAAAACLAPVGAPLSIRLGELLGTVAGECYACGRKLAGRVMSFNVRDPLMKFRHGVDCLWWPNCSAGRRVRRNEVSLMTELRPAVRRYHRMATDELNPQTGILQQLEGLSRPLPVALPPKCNAQPAVPVALPVLDRASLGDFSARTGLRGPAERLSDDWLLDDQCRSVLANARAYYAQYLPAVAAAARRAAGRVESQLKASFCSAFVRISSDFIKIVKMERHELWSVRASWIVSHRAVLKAVKQLEELLATSPPCQPRLFQPAGRNFCQRKSATAETNSSVGADFRLRRKLPGSGDVIQSGYEASGQTKSPRLKRKALSDLFKTLQQAGLSYRKGRLAALSSLDEHRCLLFQLCLMFISAIGARTGRHRALRRLLASSTTPASPISAACCPGTAAASSGCRRLPETRAAAPGHSAPTLVALSSRSRLQLDGQPVAEYFLGLQPAAGTAGCQGDGSDCPATPGRQRLPSCCGSA